MSDKPVTASEGDARLCEEVTAWVDACCDAVPLDLACEDCQYERRLMAALAEARRGCPCLYTTPCDARCTCVHPYSSVGCARCCRYGSPAQQRAMAEHLAARA